METDQVLITSFEALDSAMPRARPASSTLWFCKLINSLFCIIQTKLDFFLSRNHKFWLILWGKTSWSRPTEDAKPLRSFLIVQLHQPPSSDLITKYSIMPFEPKRVLHMVWVNLVSLLPSFYISRCKGSWETWPKLIPTAGITLWASRDWELTSLPNTAFQAFLLL